MQSGNLTVTEVPKTGTAGRTLPDRLHWRAIWRGTTRPLWRALVKTINNNNKNNNETYKNTYTNKNIKHDADHYEVCSEHVRRATVPASLAKWLLQILLDFSHRSCTWNKVLITLKQRRNMRSINAFLALLHPLFFSNSEKVES